MYWCAHCPKLSLTRAKPLFVTPEHKVENQLDRIRAVSITQQKELLESDKQIQVSLVDTTE